MYTEFFVLKLTPKHQVRTKQTVIGCFACLFLSKWVFEIYYILQLIYKIQCYISGAINT